MTHLSPAEETTRKFCKGSNDNSGSLTPKYTTLQLRMIGMKSYASQGKSNIRSGQMKRFSPNNEHHKKLKGRILASALRPENAGNRIKQAKCATNISSLFTITLLPASCNSRSHSRPKLSPGTMDSFSVTTFMRYIKDPIHDQSQRPFGVIALLL